MVTDITLTKRIWWINRNLQPLFAGIEKEALVCLVMFGFCLMMFARGNHHHANWHEDRRSFQKIPVL